MWRLALLVPVALAGCRTVTAGTPASSVHYAEAAEELGAVRWTRGVDAALARSAVSERSVLVLFDEVPGCSTVLGFGRGALSDPLLAEAIETLYEPVLVYNNTADDRGTCARFGEPRWNNPVLRVLGPDGEDRAERFAGPYTEAAFARWLVADLGDRAPRWLRNHATDLDGATRARTAPSDRPHPTISTPWPARGSPPSR